MSAPISTGCSATPARCNICDNVSASSEFKSLILRLISASLTDSFLLDDANSLGRIALDDTPFFWLRCRAYACLLPSSFSNSSGVPSQNSLAEFFTASHVSPSSTCFPRSKSAVIFFFIHSSTCSEVLNGGETDIELPCSNALHASGPECLIVIFLSWPSLTSSTCLNCSHFSEIVCFLCAMLLLS